MSEHERAAREQEAAVVGVLLECDSLAFYNMHAEWARLSVARTILRSNWLAAERARGAGGPA